jgi:RNA polymerase sigma-70 factor, ECF subfamily
MVGSLLLGRLQSSGRLEMTTVGPGPAQPTSPRELAVRIQAGEPKAEVELIERYSRGVSIIVGRIARDFALVDDLCQETFRLVLEKVRGGELREPERLSGFVCGVARNLAIEQVRQPQRMQPLEAGSPLTDPKRDPLDELLAQEQIKAVRQVLQEMKELRDREILRRFYLMEEEKDSLCAVFGISSLHFNRVLYRARERFRELYEKGHHRQ